MQGIKQIPQDPNWPEQSPEDSERAGDYNYGPYDPWVSSFGIDSTTTYPKVSGSAFDLKNAGLNNDTRGKTEQINSDPSWSPRIT